MLNIQEFTVKSYSNGAVNPLTGIYEGEQETSTTKLLNIQPYSSAKAVQEMPQLAGRDLSGMIAVYDPLNQGLNIKSVSSNPDIIEWNNQDYELVGKVDWRNNSRTRHVFYVGLLKK